MTSKINKNQKDRKHKLYNLGKEAIWRLGKRQVLGYVCPICLRVFECINDLTEEHVPPESVGGKVLCLTCRNCNCVAGHGIDAQVHQEKISRLFFVNKGQSYRAKLVVGSFQVNIGLKRNDNGTEIQVLGNQNDPKVVKSLQSTLPEVIQSRKSFQLKDTVSYSRKTADIGYLKSAYLSVFAKLGYTYILRKALNRVRQQIQNPDCQVLKTVRVYVNDISIPERIFMLSYEPISCLSVKINDSIVCLPLPDGDDFFYEKLDEMRANRCVFTWRFKGTIQWPKKFELALDFAEEEQEIPSNGCI